MTPSRLLLAAMAALLPAFSLDSADALPVSDDSAAAVARQVQDWLPKASAVGPGVVEDWKRHAGDLPVAALPTLDDTGWEAVRLNAGWDKPGSGAAWFRKRITLPTTLGGLPVAGQMVQLKLAVEGDGVAFVNGRQAQAFHGDAGRALLSAKARPGEVMLVAVKVSNGANAGRLVGAELVLAGAWSPRDAAQGYLDSQAFVRREEALEPARALALRRQENRAAQEIKTATLVTDAPEAVEAEFRRAIADLADPQARRVRDSLVGYAHTDMDWLWQWPETKDVWYRTGTTLLSLEANDPTLHFSQTQAALYRAMQQEHPDLFAGIQAAVKAGRWEPLNGWCENDMNMPSGESQIRQAILSNEWFQKNLGVTSNVCWRPDSFGHAWTLPMILAGSGVDSYFFCRAGHGVPVFWWQSPDGSRILAVNPQGSEWYNMTVSPDLANFAADRAQRTGAPEWITSFGVGDHGGGPTLADLGEAHRLDSLPALPRLQFSSAKEFFARLRAAEPPGGYPVISDENNATFPGCYTSHVDTKRLNRQLESMLYSAEAWSSIAAQSGRPYPTETLREAWYETLRDQFHDILAGSNIHPSYVDAVGRASASLDSAQKARNGALAALEPLVDTRGQAGTPVVVFNPLGWARTEVARVRLDKEAPREGAFAVRDAQGHLTYASTHSTGPDTVDVEFVAQNVPPLGFRVYWLLPALPPTPLAQTPGRLENEFFRVSYDPATGAVTGIYDKAHGRELVRAGGTADQLQALWEAPHGMSAWDIGAIQSTTVAAAAQPPVVETGADGSLFLTRTDHYHDSTLTHRLSLHPGLPRVDFDLDLDWQEKYSPSGGAFLKTAFDTGMAHPQAWWEIPFGAINRPVNGVEAVGLQWMDVDETTEQVRPVAALPISLDKIWNGDAFSAATNLGKGSFDADGRSFPAEILPQTKSFAFGGIPYRLPDALGKRNEVIAQGQTIRLPVNKGGDLYFLAAASNGSIRGSLTVTFANGRTETLPMPVSDWVQNALNLTVALTSASRLELAGPDKVNAPNIWAVHVPVDRNDPLVSVTLPNNPQVHIFALSLGPQTRQTPTFGMALLNDGRYGSDINGGVLRLSLIRSAGNPDPIFDVGKHSTRYALYPHAGGWQTSEVTRQGFGFNTPLETLAALPHPGRLGASGSFLSVSGAGIVLTCLKPALNGKGLIVRFYNSTGETRPAALRFSLPLPVRQLFRADMKETTGAAVALRGQRVSLPVPPWSVVTLRALFAPSAGIMEK